MSVTSFHTISLEQWRFAGATPWGSQPWGAVGRARGGGSRPSSRPLLVQEHHPEEELIKTKQDEVNAAWQRLKGLALQRQGKLFGAAEVQRFNRYQARVGCCRECASTWRGQVCGL